MIEELRGLEEVVVFGKGEAPVSCMYCIPLARSVAIAMIRSHKKSYQLNCT